MRIRSFGKTMSLFFLCSGLFWILASTSAQSAENTVSDDNPYDWHLERIRPQVTEAALEAQPWVKSAEPFLYPLDAEHRVDATVFSLRDPKTRLDVVWQQDAEERPCPYLIRVAGTHSRWTIGGRIALGMTLSTLEQLTSATQALKPIQTDANAFFWRHEYEIRVSRPKNGSAPNTNIPIPPERFSRIQLIFEEKEGVDSSSDDKIEKQNLLLKEIVLYFPKKTLVRETPPFTGSYLLRPGRSAGPILKNTTLDDLNRIFGNENIQPGFVFESEDMGSTATIVYPHDPLRMIAVVWNQGALFKEVESVIVEETDKSIWTCESGLTVGTSLRTFEKLNGAVFKMTTLEADNLWGLAQGRDERLRLQFDYNWYVGTPVNRDEIKIYPNKDFVIAIPGAGDIDSITYSSDPTLRKLNPLVEKIDVSLGGRRWYRESDSQEKEDSQ